MKRKYFWIAGAVLVICILTLALFYGRQVKGVRYLFKDKQFHYQTFRALSHASYGGALPGEVLSLIPRITDDESWQREWSARAARCESLAQKAADPISKGNDLLRTSNYYRAAEFFIAPSGDNLQTRKELARKSAKAFQEALPLLRISHEIYHVPLANGSMLVYFFPGSKNKPVIFMHGGFDSTTEEIYFIGGAAFVERGYPVVLFAGPGQSNMIREYAMRFTPRWHEPVGKVIDHILKVKPELAGRQKILIGFSMGGLLAGRAAAYDKRIDGVVLSGAPFKMADAALFQMPFFMRWLYRHNMKRTVNMLAGFAAKLDRGIRWGLQNGMWTVGGDNPFDMIKAFEAYTLQDVQDKVRCPVLSLYGENDIYVSDNRQLELFRNSFKNAAVYTLKIFKEEDGSAEHCQIGAEEQAVQEIIFWMQKNGLTGKEIITGMDPKASFGTLSQQAAGYYTLR
jgi:pimeloyl-ACP methyl ester carboxylesterase